MQKINSLTLRFPMRNLDKVWEKKLLIFHVKKINNLNFIFTGNKNYVSRVKNIAPLKVKWSAE